MAEYNPNLRPEDIPMSGNDVEVAIKLGIPQWQVIGLRRQRNAGKITGDEGKTGELEQRSYDRQSSRPVSGPIGSVSDNYWDDQARVRVWAPVGSYFELYDNGAVRIKEAPEGVQKDYFGQVNKKSLLQTLQITERNGWWGQADALPDGSVPRTQAPPGSPGYEDKPGGGAGGSQFVKAQYAYKNNAAYLALSDADKQFIDIAYGSFAAENEQQMNLLMGAIDQAKKLADPFFKAQLSIAQASIVDKIAEVTNDFSFKEKQLKRIRDELFEDVALNAEQLTLEEQAQLAEIGRDFDQQILGARDKAADTGTTFNTGRASLEEAEALVTGRTAGIVESLNRRTTFQLKQLQMRAERGDTVAQEELEQMKFKRGLDLRSLTRTAESTLGTTEAQKVEGLDKTQLVGGMMGTIEEDRLQSIREKIAQFFSLGSPTV